MKSLILWLAGLLALPLPPDRQIRFATGEGTWMSVDAGLDGKARTLRPGFEPAWSPDGKWIAYVTWTAHGGQIFKMSGDGTGEPQQLTAPPAFYHEPVWSPDGSGIVALRSTRLERLENGAAARDDLVEIDPQGGGVKRIVPAEGLADPQFSADASRIFLFSRQQGLVSMKLDGSGQRIEMKLSGVQEIKIGPDGKEALVLAGDQVYELPVAAAATLGGQKADAVWGR